MFNEHADGAYAVLPFFAAYNLVEIPIEIISAILFTIFTMVLVGLKTTVFTFFCMTFVVFCLVNLGESIGIAFCSVVRHVGFSVSLTNSVLGVFTVMTGIMSSNMPAFLDRINYISPIPYLARLMTVNEFDSSVSFSCITIENATNTCFYRTGADVLRLLTAGDNFAFRTEDFALYIGVGALLTAVFRIIAFFILQSQS